MKMFYAQLNHGAVLYLAESKEDARKLFEGRWEVDVQRLIADGSSPEEARELAGDRPEDVEFEELPDRVCIEDDNGFQWNEED